MGVLSLISPRLLGGLALAAALAWLAWWWRDTGVQAERARTAEAVAEFAAKAAKQESAAREISTQLQEAQRERLERVRVVREKIIQEVPAYVPPAADARCIVPRGFVQLHDAAARLSALPPAAGGSEIEPSGVPLSRVGATVADNYATAHALAAEVRAWREWYARQAANARDAAVPR